MAANMLGELNWNAGAPPEDERMEETKSTVKDSEESSVSVEERMTLALSCKDYGNEQLKQGAHLEAKEKYKEGIKHMKGITEDIGGSQALSLALNLNLTMACIKTEEWTGAIEAASEALKLDKTNVKAWYRRGLARSHEKYLEDAKTDFLEVLRLDPKNHDAAKELISLKKTIAEHKKEEKKRFGGLFDKGSLYKDKEREAKEREAKQLEEAKRRDAEWKENNMKRKERGEEEQSLEDFNKEKDSAKTLQEKEDEEKRKKAKSYNSKSGSKNIDIDEDLDEEDKKIINETKKMGYCYFGKNKERPPPPIDFQPQKIETPQQISSSDPSVKTVSSWNAAGTTYEERDASNWCKESIKNCLLKSKAVINGNSDPNNLAKVLQHMTAEGANNAINHVEEAIVAMSTVTCTVTNVEDLTGEAHIAVVRTQSKYIFDFHCSLVFELKVDLSHLPDMNTPNLPKEYTYQGKIKLPDVSSADDEYEMILGWQKAPKSPHQPVAKAAIEELKKSIKEQINAFIHNYKNYYKKS
eukprot:Platyproteum_vivax@DN3039_c0_g1_i1.p1